MQDKCVSSFAPYSMILICNLNTTLLNNKISMQTEKECQKVFMSTFDWHCKDLERILCEMWVSNPFIHLEVCVCVAYAAHLYFPAGFYHLRAHAPHKKQIFVVGIYSVYTKACAQAQMLFIFFKKYVETFQGTCMLTLHIFLQCLHTTDWLSFMWAELVLNY